MQHCWVFACIFGLPITEALLPASAAPALEQCANHSGSSAVVVQQSEHEPRHYDELFLLQTQISLDKLDNPSASVATQRASMTSEERVLRHYETVVTTAPPSRLHEIVSKPWRKIKEGLNNIFGSNTTFRKVPKHVTDNKIWNATGVNPNGQGDYDAFIATLATDTLSLFLLVCIFMIASRFFPIMYSHNVGVSAPKEIPEGLFGWIKASWYTTTIEVEESCGLDHAMLLEFTQLCIRICVIVGFPMMFCLGPAHALLGGHHVRLTNDTLSTFSFGNIQDDVRLYWVHPFIVWAVVFVVKMQIVKAHEDFMPRRSKWLKNLPEPRSTTLLVEGIPPMYRTDDNLKHFFNELFPGQIKSAYIVKKTTALLRMTEIQKANRRLLEAEILRWKAAGGRTEDRPQIRVPHQTDAITYFEHAVDEQQNIIETERKRIKTESKEPTSGVNCAAGFVTFATRTDKEVAERMIYSNDMDQWQVSLPPAPGSVIWRDLMVSEQKSFAFQVLGIFLIAALFVVYLPIIVATSNFARQINMGFLDPLWKGVAPTVGLVFMVSFLPTLLLTILRLCFTLKDDVWAQKWLQQWYFAFQVIFVLLLTAISGNTVQFLRLCTSSPFKIPQYLGHGPPFATHFYMNFLMTQWVTHGMNLTRYAILGKYILFKQFFSAEEARLMAEPEDQDFYGMGSRSVHFATNMCLCIIYGTLCPPMYILGLINFAICRTVYGYLIPYAECKKGDSGGRFWVTQLKNLFLGLSIYVTVMSGVLLGRYHNSGPALVSLSSLFYVKYSLLRFDTHWQWDELPFPELKLASTAKSMERSGEEGSYEQEELYAEPSTFVIKNCCKKFKKRRHATMMEAKIVSDYHEKSVEERT